MWIHSKLWKSLLTQNEKIQLQQICLTFISSLNSLRGSVSGCNKYLDDCSNAAIDLVLNTFVEENRNDAEYTVNRRYFCAIKMLVCVSLLSVLVSIFFICALSLGPLNLIYLRIFLVKRCVNAFQIF